MIAGLCVIHLAGVSRSVLNFEIEAERVSKAVQNFPPAGSILARGLLTDTMLPKVFDGFGTQRRRGASVVLAEHALDHPLPLLTAKVNDERLSARLKLSECIQPVETTHDIAVGTVREAQAQTAQFICANDRVIAFRGRHGMNAEHHLP